VKVSPNRLSPVGYENIWGTGPVFPLGSHGFFYYQLPPSLPPIAGEIRFRIVSTSNPASFHQGDDLGTPFDLPWCIQLLGTAGKRFYRHKWDLLLRDGLVTQSVSEYQSITRHSERKPRPTSYIHFTLDQPFPLELGNISPNIWLTANGLRMERLFGIDFTSYPLRIERCTEVSLPHNLRRYPL
jgi:hypothetical protein